MSEKYVWDSNVWNFGLGRYLCCLQSKRKRKRYLCCFSDQCVGTVFKFKQTFDKKVKQKNLQIASMSIVFNF